MAFCRNPFDKVLSAVQKQISRTQLPFLIAIDGACGSGKTTLARALADALGAPVFHTDDFYLPFALRTPQRLQMPGGHINWERLAQEVLVPAVQGLPFLYRPYDAHADRWKKARSIVPQPVYIIEGTYSLLPALETYYAYKVFLKLDTDSQYRRLQKRESEEKLNDFINRWIPREERYFRHCDTARRADIILDTSDKN